MPSLPPEYFAACSLGEPAPAAMMTFLIKKRPLRFVHFLLDSAGNPHWLVKITMRRMDTILDWSVIVLPTILSLLAMWYAPPRRRYPWRWRMGLLLFGVFISGLSYLQQRGQRNASEQQTRNIEAMLKEQRSTQQMLDDSLLREQRLNDQNNDLKTNLAAQGQLLEIMKESLPARLQRKANNIHKHWVREIQETIHTDDAVTAK